jgi:hypothetical protein
MSYLKKIGSLQINNLLIPDLKIVRRTHTLMISFDNKIVWELFDNCERYQWEVDYFISRLYRFLKDYYDAPRADLLHYLDTPFELNEFIDKILNWNRPVIADYQRPKFRTLLDILLAGDKRFSVTRYTGLLLTTESEVARSIITWRLKKKYVRNGHKDHQ